MTSPRRLVRALHIHDAANVGQNLVESANEAGQQWSITPIPWYYKRQWTGLLKHPALRARPILWDAALARKTLTTDVAHLHTGGLSPHMRWIRVPWVLHLHGTDVRTRQYDGWDEKLRFGAQNASAILYSTPDLLPHVRHMEARAEAIYFPVPVRLDDAPKWSPVPGRVIFASRWEPVKGGKAQVEVARRIRDILPGVELVGLDWGEDSAAARSAGVTLLPKMPYRIYKEWLASASVVVGQMTEILSASELEALSIGVPLVSSASREYYPDLVHLSAPTPEGVARAAVEALAEPGGAAERQDGKQFIARHHDVKVGVERLLRIYDGILNK